MEHKDIVSRKLDLHTSNMINSIKAAFWDEEITIKVDVHGKCQRLQIFHLFIIAMGTSSVEGRDTEPVQPTSRHINLGTIRLIDPSI